MTAPISSQPAYGRLEIVHTSAVAAGSADQQASGFDALLAASPPDVMDIGSQADFPSLTVTDIVDAGPSVSGLRGHEAVEADTRLWQIRVNSPAVPTLASYQNLAGATGLPETAFMGESIRSPGGAEPTAEIAEIFNEDGLFHGQVSLGAPNGAPEVSPSSPTTMGADALHVVRSASPAEPLMVNGEQAFEQACAPFIGPSRPRVGQAFAAISTAPLGAPKMQSRATFPAAQGPLLHAHPSPARIDLSGVEGNHEGEHSGAQRLTARILDMFRQARASNAEVTMEFAGESVRIFVRTTAMAREERFRLRSAIERLASDHGRKLIEIVWNGERLAGGGN